MRIKTYISIGISTVLILGSLFIAKSPVTYFCAGALFICIIVQIMLEMK